MKEKILFFLFGYSNGNGKIVYFVKRCIWFAAICLSIKCVLGFLYYIFYKDNFSGLSLIFPAIIAGFVAIMLNDFD